MSEIPAGEGRGMLCRPGGPGLQVMRIEPDGQPRWFLLGQRVRIPALDHDIGIKGGPPTDPRRGFGHIHEITLDARVAVKLLNGDVLHGLYPAEIEPVD